MKKLSFIFAALCAIASVGCKKEGIEIIEAAKTVTLPVSIEVTAPGAETKIALDPDSYAQTWQAGDEVMLASYLAARDATDGTASNSNNMLKTSGSGNKVIFSGKCSFDEKILANSKSVHYLIAPNSSWVRGATNSQFVNIPETQSGKLSDFGRYSVSFSTSFKLTKTGDVYKVPEITKLYNLCPVIKFNVANELNVRKIVIKGYQGTTQKILAAEKSNGGIQLKIGSNELYATLSNNKTLTIDRSPNTDNYYEKENIFGDVYVVLAPDFPQDKTKYPGIQWEDDTFTIYKNKDGSDRPYNTCDSLSFTFYDKHGSEYTFGAGLSDKLYSGKIKNLGNITKIPFPIPDSVFSIDENTGNLLCTNSDPEVSLHYSMTSDSSNPDTPEISSGTLYPANGIEINGSLTNTKVKVIPVKGGIEYPSKNAYLKKFLPVDKSYNKELNPGESSYLGFINFTNKSEAYYITIKFSNTDDINRYTYNHYKDSTKKEKAGNGKYAEGVFSSVYPKANCSFYIQQNNQKKGYYFGYSEGDVVVKSEDRDTPSTNSSLWYTTEKLQTKTVSGNGTVKVSFYTDSSSLKGFAWLEQGFESFLSESIHN